MKENLKSHERDLLIEVFKNGFGIDKHERPFFSGHFQKSYLIQKYVHIPYIFRFYEKSIVWVAIHESSYYYSIIFEFSIQNPRNIIFQFF